MEIKGKVALITGRSPAGLVEHCVVNLLNEARIRSSWSIVAARYQTKRRNLNLEFEREVAIAKVGDTTNDTFRTSVYDDVVADHGVVSICVPAAGITRDALAVRLDKRDRQGGTLFHYVIPRSDRSELDRSHLLGHRDGGANR